MHIEFKTDIELDESARTAKVICSAKLMKQGESDPLESGEWTLDIKTLPPQIEEVENFAHGVFTKFRDEKCRDIVALLEPENPSPLEFNWES